MNKDLFKFPFVQAVVRAHEDPPRGLKGLAVALRDAEKTGRYEAHVLADNFVGAACRAARYLGTAERVARKLVKHQPDRHHLRKLATVLELRGKKREAAAVRKRASRAKDEHMTPELAEALREIDEGA